MKTNLILFTIFFLLFSCNFNNNNKEKDLIVQVYNHKLYIKDLKGKIPKGTNYNDSIKITQKYITDWVKEKILVHLAEINLPDEKKDFTKQIENFKNNLLIYNYEKELIKKNLDTIISDSVLLNYYNKHKKEFFLDNNIYKVRFLKTHQETQQLAKLKLWISSKNKEDLKKLFNFSKKYAKKYFLNDSTWIYFSDLKEFLPKNNTQWQENYFHKVNHLFQYNDSAYVYLIFISNIKNKKDIAPFEIVKNDIKNIILAKKKLLLLEELKNKLYNDALANKKVKFYINY